MKNLQRKAALEGRRSMSEVLRHQLSEEICRRLLDMEDVKNAKKVFSYLAASDEVDLTLLHEKLRERGTVIAFPVSYKGGIMEAYVPRDENAVEEGRFGIKSPVVSLSKVLLPEETELVIAPCVAFDGEKNRLGHGGGYYDRYLPKCSKAKIICVAFECQRIEGLISEAHDVKPDFIVTEKSLVL